MDDIGKAFIMGVNVLMFIMALTISVLLYYGLMKHIDQISLTSDYSNRGDSIVDIQDENSRREIHRAEIISGILSLPQNPTDTIVVGSRTFTSDGVDIMVNGVACAQNSFALRNTLNTTFGSLFVPTTRTYSLTVSNNASGNGSRLIYTVN